MESFRHLVQMTQQASEEKRRLIDQVVQNNLPRLLEVLRDASRKEASKGRYTLYYKLRDFPLVVNIRSALAANASRDDILQALGYAVREKLRQAGFQVRYPYLRQDLLICWTPPCDSLLSFGWRSLRQWFLGRFPFRQKTPSDE